MSTNIQFFHHGVSASTSRYFLAHLLLHQMLFSQSLSLYLKGTEIIGWAPVESLKHKREEYDADRDVAFYGDAAHSLLHVKVGQMAVFFPEDAHAPNIGLGNHRKLCIKIPLQ